MAAKRDKRLDAEAQEWVEAVIGESFPADILYEDALKDGIILCKLINKLKPGSVTKIREKGSAFQMRDNITQFQIAAKAYGLRDTDLFQSVDLYDKQNISQVTQTLHALGRHVRLLFFFFFFIFNCDLKLLNLIQGTKKRFFWTSIGTENC